MSRQNAQKQIGKQSCPDCGATIPAYPRYTPWCDHCNWNIQPDNVASTRWWQQRISQKMAARLFRQMRADRPHKRLTGTHKAALLSMLVIYLLNGWLLWIAGSMILTGGFGRILAGIFLLFFTLRALVIRYDNLPPNMMRIDEKRFPALYKHIGEIARRLDLPMPQVALSAQFTATFARIGPKRKPLLCVGIPFLAMLTAGEMTSLFGHELSHANDGAITRSLHVQNARTALESWVSLLSFRRWRQHSNRLIAVCGHLFALPCFPVWIGAWGFLQLFELLLLHDSQRAEYVADLQSLAIAGNRDAPYLLQKSYYRYLGALQEAYANAPLHQKYGMIQRTLAEIPAREKERVWRIAMMQQPKLKSSHPTVKMRLALIEDRSEISPAYVIEPKQFAAIQAELRAWPQVFYGYETAYLREVERADSAGVLSAVSAD